MKLSRNEKSIEARRSRVFLVVLGLLFLTCLSVLLYFFADQAKRTKNAELAAQPKVKQIKTLEMPAELGSPVLQKEGEKILFTDQMNKYYLDVSSLPEIQLKNPDVWTIYEFEMYDRYGRFEKSVARFGFSEPKENIDNLDLRQFATENFFYEEGTKQSGGWGDQLVSEIEDTTVGDHAAIRWTEESAATQGFFFENYLFDLDGKVVLVRLVAWDKSVFDKNRLVLEKILRSFKKLP